MNSVFSAKFEEDNAFVVDVEVDVVTALIGDHRGEAFAYDAMPVGAKSQRTYEYLRSKCCFICLAT